MNYLQKKKLAFMSIVNRVKGFIRTVTGALPLTLEGCVDEESIIDYTLYGQSVQNGTPTPETPVEVESVGEKTRNLITATDGYIVNYGTSRYIKYDAKTQVFTIHGYGFLAYINLPETIPNGTTTSIFAEIVNDDYAITKGSLAIGGYAVTGGWANAIEFSATSTKKKSRVATITKDANRLALFVDSNASVKNVQVRITYAVCDTEFTEYEPYGYKIPIKVSGKNLLVLSRDNQTFTQNGVTFEINKDKGITMNGTCTADMPIEVSKDNGFTAGGGTYTLCGCFGGSTSTYYMQTQNGFTDTGKGVIVSIKEDKNIVRLYVKKGAVLDNVTVYPMLLKGNYVGKVPDYEPYHKPITTNIYLDEPLGDGQSISYKKDGLPKLSTFKGTSIISADTTIQPSSAEIEYYSNVKE